MSKTKCSLPQCQHLVWDNIIKSQLDIEDVNNIALIYTDVKYKSLVKLIDNVILDLQNKGFREAESLEQFQGIKWTRNALEILKQQVTSNYTLSIRKQNEKESPEESALRYAEAQEQNAKETSE